MFDKRLIKNLDFLFVIYCCPTGGNRYIRYWCGKTLA